MARSRPLALRSLSLVGCMLAPTLARAEPPVWQWTPQAPDGEDPHTRPPGWDELAVPEPAPFYIAPEYPLAVAFTPAHSNNFTPDGIVSYDWVVVHTMQGSYAGTISWFQNPDAVVSTQYVMRHTDGEVTQMVLDKDRAYHVGNSNRYALGIEHDGYVDQPAKFYTWATYTSSALLTRWLTIKHAIPVDRTHIVGHVELPAQTHTDPGAGWNWDLYMALIKEVVPPSEIHGVVVDRDKACTLTASVATQLKRTALATDLLAATDLCAVPAGATLTYWHARRDIDGHHHLLMPGGEGPCAGINDLDADAYIVAADWSALCADEAIAAAGVGLQIDGGAQTTAAPDGRFVFTVPPGAHTIDATAPGLYEPASEPVDLAVYPGARLVIALDPAPAPDPTGDPADPTGDPADPTGGPTTGGPGGSGEVGEVGEVDSASEASGLTTAGASEASSEASGEPGDDTGAGANTPTEGSPGYPSLPGGYGQGDAGCACHTPSSARPPGLAALLLLGLLGLRRRRPAAVRTDRSRADV